jgi:hypothetical protein
MQTPGEIRRELPADLDEAEREALVAIAMRLQGGRPAPKLAFREELRKELVGESSWRRAAAFAGSQDARVVAAGYSLAGLLLLVVAAIGLAGVGPFA